VQINAKTDYKEFQMQAITGYRFGTASAVATGLSAGAHRRAALSVVRKWIVAFVGVLWIAAAPMPASAQGHPELEANARVALSSLERQQPLAAFLAKRAVAILVFPEVTKAGFLIGGEYGNGVMFRGGRFAGHYNTAGVTYGLQAGAQTFGYALFFMNERALEALNAASGFQVGVGPSVVVLDQGQAKSLTS